MKLLNNINFKRNQNENTQNIILNKRGTEHKIIYLV